MSDKAMKVLKKKYLDEVPSLENSTNGELTYFLNTSEYEEDLTAKKMFLF